MVATQLWSHSFVLDIGFIVLHGRVTMACHFQSPCAEARLNIFRYLCKYCERAIIIAHTAPWNKVKKAPARGPSEKSKLLHMA